MYTVNGTERTAAKNFLSCEVVVSASCASTGDASNRRPITMDRGRFMACAYFAKISRSTNGRMPPWR